MTFLFLFIDLIVGNIIICDQWNVYVGIEINNWGKNVVEYFYDYLVIDVVRFRLLLDNL